MQPVSLLPLLLLPLTALASPTSSPGVAVAALAPRRSYGRDDSGGNTGDDCDDGDDDDGDYDDGGDDDDGDDGGDDGGYDDGDDGGHDGGHGGHGGHGGKCLSDDEAQKVVDVYVSLIAAYNNDTANTYLADDFVDYSDSINQLIGKPLGSATFPSKAAFMAAQAKNPPLPLTVENIAAVDCTSVAIIWHVVFGAGNSARGLTAIEVEKSGDIWQISRLDVEFNSLTWLLNVGGGYCLNGKAVGNAKCP